MPVTVAVIPFRRAGARATADPREALAHLVQTRRVRSVEIAQHGYAHANCLNGLNKRSEFTGSACSEERRTIAEGQRHLAESFGCTITGFVPPWNTCD